MENLIEMDGSGMVALLQEGKLPALWRMYKLFNRVKGGHQLMRQHLVDHLKSIGKAMVLDPEKLKEPVDYMTQLLETKLKYDR